MFRRLYANPFLSLAALFQSKLFKDTTFVFIGNFVSPLILFVGSIILARFWGLAAFGALTFLFGMAGLAVGLTDLGIKISVVRWVSEYREADQARYHFLLLAVLVVEALLGALIVIVALLGAPRIAAQFLDSTAESATVQRFLLGAAFTSAGVYASAVLQAHQRFPITAALALLDMTLRTLGMIAASFFFQTIQAVAVAYLIASVTSMAIGYVIVLKRYPPWPGLAYPLKRDAARGFFLFGKWVAVTVALNAILLRVDVILLSALSNVVQVALYGVAFQISLGAVIAVNMFNTILLPRASRIQNRADLRRYSKQALVLSIIVGCGIGIVFLFAESLVILLYGKAFLNAVPILRLLLTGSLFFAFTYPYILLIYRLNRPDLQTKTSVVGLCLLVIGDWLLIPLFGAMGPAVMFVALIVVGQATLLVWLVTRGPRRAAEIGLVLRESYP